MLLFVRLVLDCVMETVFLHLFSKEASKPTHLNLLKTVNYFLSVVLYEYKQTKKKRVDVKGEITANTRIKSPLPKLYNVIRLV